MLQIEPEKPTPSVKTVTKNIPMFTMLNTFCLV